MNKTALGILSVCFALTAGDARAEAPKDPPPGTQIEPEGKRAAEGEPTKAKPEKKKKAKPPVRGTEAHKTSPPQKNPNSTEVGTMAGDPGEPPVGTHSAPHPIGRRVRGDDTMDGKKKQVEPKGRVVGRSVQERGDVRGDVMEPDAKKQPAPEYGDPPAK